MCKILSDLNKHNISLSVRYYGIDDLISSFEIKEIIENADFFDLLFSGSPIITIATLDDYLVYLYAIKFRDLSELIPHLIQDDHKTLVMSICSKANAVLSNINKGDLICFINKHIEDIFTIDDHDYDIRDATISLIKEYITGIDFFVLQYLCSNFYWIIIDNFDAFYKVIKETPALFEKLYPSGHLSELQKRRFDRTLDIFANVLNSKNSALKTYIDDRVSELCIDAESLISSITTDNVMHCEPTIRELKAFLQRIKHPKANDFEVHYKTINQILIQRIDEKGHHAQYEIPIGEIIDHFTNIKNWIVRLLSLTHSAMPNLDATKFTSRLNYEKENTHHLVDLCSTNIPTDDYFTYSHQQSLNIHAAVGASTMIGILSRPEVSQDLRNLIASSIYFVEDQLNRKDEHLTDDWILLDHMLQNIVSNIELDGETLYPLCYSAAMFTCSFIEKILRLFYIDRVKNHKYISVDGAALGSILSEKNAEIVSVFGVNHIKHLSFFLLKNGDSKAGHNYRNRLAHWSEIDKSSLTISLVGTLLWLFIDVLNTIFFYYYKQLPTDLPL